MSLPFFTLLHGGTVLTPTNLGRVDILLAGDKIAAIGKNLNIAGMECIKQDMSGLTLAPGLIDNHVHLIGGGGEGGPATRTPEVRLSAITCSGTTTVVGCLGTDGISRHTESLLAKCRALDAEGITSYMYTGAYAIPTPTITGSVQRDLILIDKVIGAGEIALSDHRSSQSPYEDYLRLVAQARLGGMLAAKAGVVNVHLGSGKNGMSLLFRMVETTEIPITQFIPTHINRSQTLLSQGIEWAKRGGYIDITAGIVNHGSNGCVNPADAIRTALDQGVALDRILISSDGNGSMPSFDEHGNTTGLTVAALDTVIQTIRTLVRSHALPLESALQIATLNPATALRLWPQKACLQRGADADILVLDQELNVIHVWARGAQMVTNGKATIKGNFE